MLTESSLDLKERCIAGDKYLKQLRKTLSGADRAFASLYQVTKTSLERAQQMLLSIESSERTSEFKNECDRLNNVIERHIRDLEIHNLESNFENMDLAQISDKIKSLEARQKLSDNYIPPRTSSSRNVKADVNEKYPETLSRESLIDLNTVNLPPVPEDIFTGFSNRPTRSSSLSSLKSMRKIKMYLQRAESSEDEDSSDADDHEYQKLLCVSTQRLTEDLEEVWTPT